MRKFLVTFAIFNLLFTFLTLPVSASEARFHGPRIKNKNGTSLNWSGYAAIGSSTTDVKGSWVVPNLTCGTTNTYSSAWVGIDGYNDNTVEQTGTEQDCINGQPQYYAWFEMYPKPSYMTNINVKAGDTITAEVKYVGGGKFILSLKSSNGQTFSISQKSYKAQLGSAEWIMEAPYSGGILPLANFGTANFSNSQATIGGKTATISGFTFDQINMANSGGVLKDQTSPLSPDGSSFNITWLSSI